VKYKERDRKEHTRIPKLDARVSDDYYTDVCYELTMVEADDMSKSANPSPEFSNNRHYCTVNKHSLGPDLPSLLDPVNKKSASATCKEIQSREA
jgi:hypothetical protein